MSVKELKFKADPTVDGVDVVVKFVMNNNPDDNIDFSRKEAYLLMLYLQEHLYPS